ncbi:MAG: phosphoglycerate kinase, partial [bacterium]|nr:phosphoglycerate kinase [bacterium]
MRFLSKLSPKKIIGKRFLVRVDFNVTLDEKGKILDDFRIRACLPTIKYLAKNSAKVILISHLSKSQLTFKQNKNQNVSLRRIAVYLSRLLGKKTIFVSDCRGEKVRIAVAALSPGQVILLENLRFYPEEEKNDPNFAKELSGLADFYVNDGFAVSHRPHASVVGVTDYLPGFAGLLLEKEIKNLDKALKNPPRPLVVIIGGAKVSTKIKLIENFLEKRSEVILGGVIANTVLCAKGVALGKSLVEPEIIAALQKLDLSDVKLHLPIDVLVADSAESNKKPALRAVGNVQSEEIIFDIGPDSIKLFKEIIKRARMIIWNGPMGLVEKKEFRQGTEAVARAIASVKDYSVIGGGDTVIILN